MYMYIIDVHVRYTCTCTACTTHVIVDVHMRSGHVIFTWFVGEVCIFDLQGFSESLVPLIDGAVRISLQPITDVQLEQRIK